MDQRESPPLLDPKAQCVQLSLYEKTIKILEAKAKFLQTITEEEKNPDLNPAVGQSNYEKMRQVKQNLELTHTHFSEFQNEESILDINDFSSISKIFRITAWIQRFISNVKLKKEDRIKTPLAAGEIEEAEEIWIRKYKQKILVLRSIVWKKTKIYRKIRKSEI
ncbi:hypothetical protein TNCT_669251 [Trichonephila clavata]|uniref:Uncharacterized protein n=1 Tax=Trichonephila clavata TaxID=2740835 RepID=A0A8X6I4E9_TRICU|nr:hypothetical protein TNCT_669251 [Trichonephila clavata]